MLKRLSTEEVSQLHNKYKKDRLFQNLYAPISTVIGPFHSITPEEIWKIALQNIETIVHGENGVFEIDALPNSLHFLFAEYQNAGEDLVQKRVDADVSNICFCVELAMLYQLTRFQNDWRHHPYFRYCVGILSQIKDNPHFERVSSLVREANDRYEINYGSELEPIDYVPSLVKDGTIIQEAVQLTLDCAEYLNSGYDIQWLKYFWNELIFSSEREYIIKQLQNKGRYVLIYTVIGLLRKENVFHGTEMQLGSTHFTKDTSPSSDTIRRYVSKGMEFTVTPIAKFVNHYVLTHKGKKN